MRYTLIRNATALLEYGGNRIILDPALDPVGYRPPVANTAIQRQNPLVDLPSGSQQLVSNPDALLITHLHSDHFDTTAQEQLAGSTPTFCQPEDVDTLTDHGFTNVQSVDDEIVFGDVTITRTPASHGTGKVGRQMAPVSGFVLQARSEPTLYIAGDTIWYEGVANTIARFAPDVIVINASGASFLEGGKIVMDAQDVVEVRRAEPNAKIIVVHLEAINHCHETREYYRTHLPALGVNLGNIAIPEDGESVS